MIYADKEKNENQFVSVNTITRGRILKPVQLFSEGNPVSSFPAVAPTNQSLAPSTDGMEVERYNREEPATGVIQAKTMTTAASAVNPPAGTVSKSTSTSSNVLPGGGEPIPEHLRARMENVIGGNFAAVRLHHDAQAAAMAKSLGAKAFTRQTDIYFNHGQYQPATTAGLHLLAHELAHVQQQTTVPGLAAKLEEPAARARYEQEADTVANKVAGYSYQPAGDQAGTGLGTRASHSVDGGGGSIQLKAEPETKSETGSDANWFMTQVSKLVRNIPGYDLLALVIGRDPLTGQTVPSDAHAWIKAVAGLLPGGAILFENLQQAGVITKAVTWLKEEIKKLGITYAKIKELLDQVWTAIVGPQTPDKGTEATKKGWFASFADAVKDFAGKAANVGRALFSPEATFAKINEIIAPMIDRITGFLATVGPKLKEFTFEGALTLAKVPVEKVKEILDKGKDILQTIFDDPVGFLRNLLQAIHGGLQNFLQNFGAYLRAGLAGWLFGVLSSAGIIFPTKLDLAGIFSLIAQILGVTWQAIKTRVINLLGPAAEKVITQVEKTVTVVVEFITKGPTALYEMAAEFLGDLKARFFDSMIEWVRNTLIVKGVQKLIAMFNPVTAIVQAIMTIGGTIKFFIDKAKEIAAFANAVFDSIIEIAVGNLKKAIQAVEDSLGKALPVAIGFLVNLAGIGGIAAKIKEVIQKLRQPIDRAVEKVVNFVADKARALLGRKGKPATTEEKESPEKTEKLSRGLAAIDQEEQKYLKDNRISRNDAEKVAATVKRAHPVFKSLTVIDGGDSWDYEYVASPKRIKEGQEKAEGKSNIESSTSPGTIKRVAYDERYTIGKNGRKELKPNIEYITPGGHKYRTDELGRIKEVEGRLKLKKAARKPYDQRVVGREDRVPSDEGGHLIASIFEGSGELDNLVAMSATLNRGDWRAMERVWAKALSEGKEVEVQIRLIYSSTSLRPVAFEVKYCIGTGSWQKENHLN